LNVEAVKRYTRLGFVAAVVATASLGTLAILIGVLAWDKGAAVKVFVYPTLIIGFPLSYFASVYMPLSLPPNADLVILALALVANWMVIGFLVGLARSAISRPRD
jgi:hypothetical protein